MDKQIKPKRELTPEQLEVLKARLMKARQAKLDNDKASYNSNKEQIKEEGFKKRTLSKMKALVSKGVVKDEELQEMLPKQIPINTVVNEIVKELPFDQPLPTKRIPKPKPVKQPDVIPFEQELPKPKPSKPITINKAKEPKFMKLVYYSEPSKKTMKKLSKMHESSSSDSDTESSDDEPVVKSNNRKPVLNNEDEYYKELAKKIYG